MSFQAVRLHRIRKGYRSTRVFDDFNLEVAPGEFLVLLGPSGCGKSTLLNIIAGVEPHEGGQVFIGDRDVTRLEPGQRNIAMVFQSFALYPTMTARANMAFALKMSGMAEAEITRRVERMASVLQIEMLLGRKPAQLSGGQQQRVAIGRALVRNPSVLLLDEPLSNLDAKLRAELRAQLRKLHESDPRTTLYVTHDQLEALMLASRIAVMHQGQVLQCDTPGIIYQRPANRTVASFVGTPAMNFVDGSLDLAGPAAVLQTRAGTRIPLPGLKATASLAGDQRPVVLGVRAEHIHVVPMDTPASTTGRVLAEELAGADTYLLADVGGHELTIRTSTGERIRRGESLPIRIDGGAASLFCPASGRRLN
jgi:multiple sugar transport system ATP-binding protein